MMNKVAIVTGASRGIGRACALRLGKAGMNVAVNYNSSEGEALNVVNEIIAMGGDAIAVKADMSDEAQVKAMVRDVFKKWGQIDILVNNAGIVKDEYLLMMATENIDKCLGLNIRGYLLAAQQVALKMFRKKSGRIINVSSVSSQVAIPGQTVYSATKGAVNSMTATMAKELAPYGITVNAIAPGFIKTDMVDKLPEEKQTEYNSMIPMKRFGLPEEVAEMVYTMTGDAFSYVTGQVIVIDGGLSL